MPEAEMNGKNSNVKYVSAEEGGTQVVFAGPPGSSQSRSSKTPGFSGWSKLELRLILLCVFFAIVIITLIIILAARSPQKAASKDVCLTHGCVNAASRILKYIDTTVDPCDNFYDFACGNWNKTNVIPADKAYYNTFSKLTDELQVILKRLLESPTEGNPDAIVKAKTLYASCMNESQIDLVGLEPVRRLLSHLGGWPVLNTYTGSTKNYTDRDVLDVLVKLCFLNNRIVVDHWVNADDKNSSVNILQFDQSELGMSHPEFFLEPRYEFKLKVYEKYAYDVAVMFGADPKVAKQDITDMIEFEKTLASIHVPQSQRRDNEKMYNKMTVRDLIKLVPGFQWLEYLQRFYSAFNITITEEEELVNYSPSYYEKLGPVYHKTDKRTIVNYLIWRVMMKRIGNLPREYRKIRNDYVKIMMGSSHESARWIECVSLINDYMGNALGRLFVAEQFDETSKETASEMIHSIRDSLFQLLDEAEWMNARTRKVAKEKAKYMAEKIGYPEYVLNDTALNEEYGEVKINPDQFFDNVIAHLKYVAARLHKELRKPVDRSEWSTTPAIVNAFYSSNKNSIMIPAGILQPPFYSKDYPKSLNYGGIGMVIGHEITHGFDDRGRQYDKDGILMKWWDEDVITAFKERAQCIIGQYANYTSRLVNMNVNGIHTQGENIADNGGLKEAYMAYKKYQETPEFRDLRLPGLQEFNSDQLFFITFAQVWCGSMRPEHAEERLKTGLHSPGIFRVIGTLQNMESFSKTFQCPVGAYMNRRRKCKVW